MARMRLSIGGVVAAAFWAVAVLGATMLPMTDPDTWWHIRVGREILNTGSIPTVDTWSIAGAGHPWISQDWASNVLMAALFDAGGATLVSGAYGVMAAVAIAVLWDAIGVRQPSIGWLGRSAWLLFGIVLAAPVLGARVQVVDLLLAAATVNVLWRHLVAPRPWHAVALPLIALGWVNLHAGFPLLFLIGGAVVVGAIVDRWLGRVPAVSARPSITRLVVSLLASAAVLAINPNGVAIYTYPFETLGLSALSAFVGEWQPASFGAPAGQLLALFIVGGLLPTLLYARDRLRVADGLVLIGLVFMATTAVRFLLVAGPIGATVVCVTLAPALSESAFGQAFANQLARLSRVPRGPRGFVNAAIAAILVLVGAAVVTMRIGPQGQSGATGEVFPVAAVAWLDAHPSGDRIFNRYEWGGYLGLQRPGRPIFIDGRADVYGDEVLLEYVETISAHGDPQAVFDRYQIDHVLFPGDTTLGRWLAESGAWEEVYSDSVATVWVSR
jgi:hypothetical protein